MKKTDKAKNPFMKILIIIQVLLVCIFIFVALNYLPPIWKQSGSIGTMNTNSSGGKVVPVYQMSLGVKDTVRYYLNSSSPLNDEKLAQEYITLALEQATFDYIDEYGYDSDINYKVLSSTKDDFRYSINGSPTGESWQVWVCIADINNPQVAVFKGEAL